MIKRFLPTETTYNHNKHILKPLRAEVVEEANGIFELEIELPKGTQLNKRDIITAPTPRGVQPFRVYRITKTLQGIKAYARHIFYDLANALLLDVRPTNTNVNGALQSIFNAVGWSGWSYLSDITDLRTAYYIRKNPVEAIIGAENSILNVWGGNLIRNGKEVRINASGVDRGYEIRLGKNLIGIEDDSDDSNVVTRLYPTFERNQVIYGIPEGYVDSPLIGNYPTPIAKEIRVALTDEQKELPDADIHDILRDYCNNLYSVDNVDKPVVNYKIDFVQLAKVARIAQERKYTYAGLEQLTYETLQTLTYGELQSVNVIEQFTDLLEKVDLYDLVKIKVKELDIDLQARVISYRYDCIGERYAKLELGGFKPSNQYQTSNIVQQIKNEREKASEEFRELYDLAINKVTGNAGGYQITRRNTNDEPYETLWMDTPDIQTAQKVLRINQNGIAGSANGFNGPYSVAITTDGWIVAERIQAINLSAISANLGTVTAGRIEDGSGENYWDLNTGDMNLNDIKIAGKKVSVSLSEVDGKALNAQATADAVTLAFNNQEIGVVNMIKNGSIEFDYVGWSPWSNTSITKTSDGIRVKPLSSGVFDVAVSSPAFRLKNGQLYTLSFDAASFYSTSVLDYIWLLNTADGNIRLSNVTIVSTDTTYRRYKLTFTSTSSGDNVKVLIGRTSAPNTDAGFVLKNVQLEEGNKATAFKNAENEIKALTHKFDASGYQVLDSNGNEIMSLSKGIANEQNIGRVDNVESGYRMRIPFHIGIEVSQIVQAILKWDVSKFRTYSKGAASGGGTKTTPSGGAGTTGIRWGATGVAVGTTGYTVNSFGSPHSHQVYLDDLSHNHSTPAHTHSMDITHSHDPVFGILEQNISDNIIEIYVDGVYRTSVNASQGEVDLSTWITTSGWHRLELASVTLKRIDANLFLKTYIRR